MLAWRKFRSTMTSELRCYTARMRADFQVGHQRYRDLTAFTPMLPQPMKTFIS